MLILELVINTKVDSENIVGKVKIIFDTSLPMLTLFLLKCLVYISHIALLVIVLIHELVINENVYFENIVG